MSFKVTFFLIVSFGKYCSFTRLKREDHLSFVPVPGLNVKIDNKTHLIENVEYDLDTHNFNVILEDDESSRYTYRVLEVDELVAFYIEDGWEEFIPTDYKNVITTPEMHDIIIAVNDVEEVLKPDEFIEMICAMMMRIKLTGSLQIRELFYFCDLDTCQEIRIMERLKELQKIKRDNDGK